MDNSLKNDSAAALSKSTSSSACVIENALKTDSAEHHPGEEDLSGVAVAQQNEEEVDLDKAADDNTSEDVQGASAGMENLMDMYEESFKRFAEGEVVTGRIISVDKDYVLVDIGYKSEGQIRINEFKDEKGEIHVNMGDDVEVMVEFWDEDEERVILSKEKAAKVKVWEDKRKYAQASTNPRNKSGQIFRHGKLKIYVGEHECYLL